MTFEISIDEPQPSQLYLNGRKLALATEWFDFDEPNYDPVPVVKMEGDLVLTDGHTRAFLASLAGAKELQVRRDEDDLPLDVYRECVGWCKEAEITRIEDLHGRTLNSDTFVEKWVKRCQAVADDLE